jgi:hypothetical protein
VFLMETWRRRPPDAFKLGGWGRGTFPECSFGDKQPNLANQRPPFCVRLLLPGGSRPISDEYIGNSSILRQTRNR